MIGQGFGGIFENRVACAWERIVVKPARPKTRFVCQECGYHGVRWSGRCPECAEWNSLREEVDQDLSTLEQRSVAGGTPEAVRIGALWCSRTLVNLSCAKLQLRPVEHGKHCTVFPEERHVFPCRE